MDDLRGERRRRQRIAVHWPIRVTANGNGEAVERFTEDLSSCGFFFVSSEPFALGDRLDWLLTVPSQGAGRVDLVLRGSARVVRVKEMAKAGDFGVGCFIDDYSVVPLVPRDLEPAHEGMMESTLVQ